MRYTYHDDDGDHGKRDAAARGAGTQLLSDVLPLVTFLLRAG